MLRVDSTSALASIEPSNGMRVTSVPPALASGLAAEAPSLKPFLSSEKEIASFGGRRSNCEPARSAPNAATVAPPPCEKAEGPFSGVAAGEDAADAAAIARAAASKAPSSGTYAAEASVGAAASMCVGLMASAPPVVLVSRAEYCRVSTGGAIERPAENG